MFPHLAVLLADMRLTKIDRCLLQLAETQVTEVVFGRLSLNLDLFQAMAEACHCSATWEIENFGQT
jgi:hypothetical protein